MKIGVIPARIGSRRLYKKPLVSLRGKKLLQWVIDGAKTSKLLDKIYVATDSEEIMREIKDVEVVLVKEKCPSGTDRVYKAIKKLGIVPSIVVNIQGDEPLVKGEDIDNLIHALEEDNEVAISTLFTDIKEMEEIENPNIVKVVFDKYNYALYFSRSPIPYNFLGLKNVRYYKHIGIYAFKFWAIERFVSLAPSNFEKIENLEQLRALENGLKIKMVYTSNFYFSIDTKEDIERFEKSFFV